MSATTRGLITGVFLVLACASVAFGSGGRNSAPKDAEAEPSYHQDAFGERHLWMGFKAGPQVSGYTPIYASTGTVNVQSSLRPAGGFAIEFIYDLLRLELELFVNLRGGLNNDSSYVSAALPLLLKLPVNVAPDFELELGAGYQPDLFIAGQSPHRSTMSSLVASVGAVVALASGNAFTLEGRYVYGLETLDASFSGGKPREIQVLLGHLWRF